MGDTTNSGLPALLQMAIDNTMAAVTNQVAALNETLRTNYLAKFSAYAADVMAGRSDPAGAPKPPNAYVVGSFADPTTGPESIMGFTIHWPTPQVGMQPVCDMPTLPTPPAQSGPVGDVPSVTGYRNVPLGDTAPVGYIATDPANGDQWQKQTIRTLFGVTQAWVLIASDVTPDLVHSRVR